MAEQQYEKTVTPSRNEKMQTEPYQRTADIVEAQKIITQGILDDVQESPSLQNAGKNMLTGETATEESLAKLNEGAAASPTKPGRKKKGAADKSEEPKAQDGQSEAETGDTSGGEAKNETGEQQFETPVTPPAVENTSSETTESAPAPENQTNVNSDIQPINNSEDQSQTESTEGLPSAEAKTETPVETKSTKSGKAGKDK